MGETPANTYPVVSDAPTEFYVESALTGFGRYSKTKVAHAEGASVGDIFIVGAGPVVNRLAIGSTGQTLIVSGGTLAYTSGFAYQRIAQTVISSPVSSIVFSSLAASGFSKYILTLNDVVSAAVAATDALLIQVSTDNGSTWKTTNGDYVTQAGTNRTSLTGSGITIPASTSASPALSATCEIIGLGVANRVTALSYTSTRSVTGGISMEIPTTALACYRNAREKDDAIRVISTAAANLSAGIATLYAVVE